MRIKLKSLIIFLKKTNESDLRTKLEGKLSSYRDITEKLSNPEVYSDQTKMKSLNQELTKLEPIVKLFQKYLIIEKSILETKELLV